MKPIINKIYRLLFSIILSYASITYTVAEPQHAMTLYGDLPKYPANFTHFDYTNPNAPKGGTLRLASYGGFDTFNSYIPRGNPAAYLNLLYSTLTIRSLDEPNTIYGLVAEKMEKASDDSSVRFYLRKEAKFNDGHPITAEDVVFTFNTLITKGEPMYRQYYADVDKVIAENKYTVLFKFKTKYNRELPMIMGELQILPKHWWKDKDFSSADLTPPLGSGPYQITRVNPGASVTYTRVKNWWGQNIPAVKGFYNFDKITVDYYRDMSVSLEAFKAGQFDYNLEYSAKNWATGYEGAALKQNHIIKKELNNHNPAPIQGFVFNIRRPIFKDKRVREAISLLFDFEWSNKQLFFNSYKRLGSYFENSEMAAHQLPTPEELAILEPLKGKVPEEVFTTVYTPPKSDGSGIIREQQRKAYQLLKEAGYEIKNGKMVNQQGKQLSFEFLLSQPQLERVVLPFKTNLAEIGIHMDVRRIDTAQYLSRFRSRDYDMLSFIWGQSNSPGNEQRNYWTSVSADQNSSMNAIGLKDPAVDILVEQLTQADSRESLINHARALDRVLQWGYYLVWNYYTDKWRVAYWNKFGQPNKAPDYDIGLFSWWSLDAQKVNQTHPPQDKQSLEPSQQDSNQPEKVAQ